MNKLFWIVGAMVANTIAAATILPQQQSIDGAWNGSLTIGPQTLRITVRFTTSETGLRATIDIPQQGATGVQLQNVSYDDSRVYMELPAGPGLAVFDGRQVGDSIGGAFTQAGLGGTFFLKRSSQAAAMPKEPPEPLPYAEEEVTFHNADITLAGTLTLPESGAPHPAVVMITGSGPQNRDEELFGFKPFHLIADHLTRNGIAVLRFDDRGVGGSTGSVSEATTEDFARDVLAAVDFLKNRSDIDPERIGLIGHSEGGIVAPLASSMSDDVAFMVLMAGTSVSGAEILIEQGALIMRASGATEADMEQQIAFQKRTFEAIRSGDGWDELAADLETRLRESIAEMPDSQRNAITDVDAYIDAQIQAQLTALQTPWLRYFLDYDPAVTLRTIDTPILALFGELDLQVPPAQNRGPLEQALRDGNHPDYTVRVLPRANHLFITATTGSPTEYATLEKVFVPEFLPLITEWILERVSR
ncbi:MAG: alpha/beta fold hydrolase [Gemmatimonadetes bacterium]|nr:alpha/beta fold hydrolase [Gemmatimonadota bacterium]